MKPVEGGGGLSELKRIKLKALRVGKAVKFEGGGVLSGLGREFQGGGDAVPTLGAVRAGWGWGGVSAPRVGGVRAGTARQLEQEGWTAPWPSGGFRVVVSQGCQGWERTWVERRWTRPKAGEELRSGASAGRDSPWRHPTDALAAAPRAPGRTG